jgi:hypothetical protein
VLDVHDVRNGTSCDLNEVIWAPNCWLPTARLDACRLHFSSEMLDFDIREMFLNFYLTHELRQYVGVPMEAIADNIKKLPGQKPVLGTEACMELHADGVSAEFFLCNKALLPRRGIYHWQANGEW